MTSLATRLKSVLEQKHLTQYDLAEMVGTTQGAISNIIKGETQKPRNLLDIANALGVDPYWLQNGGDMNVNHTKMENSQINNNQGQTVNNFFAKKEQYPTTPVDSKQSDNWIVTLGKNKGSVLEGLNQRFTPLLEAIKLSDDGLIELLKLRSARNIEMITMFNDSMTPLINKKDLLLIDSSYTQYAGEGIYLFIMNNELYVRRMQQTPEGVLKAISENSKTGSTFDIEPHHLERLTVLGKCIRKITLQAEEL